MRIERALLEELSRTRLSDRDNRSVRLYSASSLLMDSSIALPVWSE